MDVILTVRVSDTGIGISEQDLNALFLPFFRSKEKQSLMSNKSGHGLGLHICKNIVKQLNGEISV
jgi:signal transduction histidine kinase